MTLAALVEEDYGNAKLLNLSDRDADSKWMLDSGCTYHMTPYKSWFESYRLEDGEHVLLGSNRASKVLGQGTTRLKSYNGQDFVLYGVRFAPKLKRNLKSLGVNDQLGYVFREEQSEMSVTKGKNVGPK